MNLGPKRLRRGAGLLIAMVALLVVSLVAAGLVQALLQTRRQTDRYADEWQAQWLAEAGLARARARLVRDPSYAGETWLAPVSPPSAEADSPATGQAAGKVVIQVLPGEENAAPRELVVTAAWPADEPTAVRASRRLQLPEAPPGAPAPNTNGPRPASESGESR